jgi:hypothetical protein
MTRALTRTNLHSSKLIRVLNDLALLEAVEPGTAFAEKLGLWLNLNDAITLCAAHNTRTARQQTMPPRAAAVGPDAMGDELAKLQAALANSIAHGSSTKGSRTRMALPVPKFGEPLEVGAAYEPYRRYYLAHQRQMDSSVGPLRTQVREVLAKASPALKTLAALDAVFDAILCDHESKLLAKLPSLLAQRFDQLLTAHQQALIETQQADDPAGWMKPGGWLVRFCHELQTVLLAELDVRLQPTVGLVEAFNNEMTTHP